MRTSVSPATPTAAVRAPWSVRNTRGIAIILTLMITMAVAALALGGIMLSGSGSLAAKFHARESVLNGFADAGIEIARDSLNRNQDLVLVLPDSSPWRTLGPISTIRDASGTVIPGFTRTVYAGKTGGRTGGRATAGQYGSNFASVISVIQDTRGAVAARRALFTQESWSRFAVAVDNWSNTGISYTCSFTAGGPYHSNSLLRLPSPCTTPRTTFLGPATVVSTTVTNEATGDFRAGLTKGAPVMPFPTPAQLATMRQYAQDGDAINGDYDLTSLTIGTTTPTVRIEFVTLDVNGNGTIEWDEGFVRVYRTYNTADTALAYLGSKRWMKIPAGVTATTTSDPNLVSRNCGAPDGLGIFRTASGVFTASGGAADTKRNAARAVLTEPDRRCYLGGDPHLFTALTGDTLTPLPTWINPTPNVFGEWIPRRLGALPAVAGIRTGDGQYFIPLGSNPNFKGVIYVTGDVAVSGRLRGRVSIVATGNILLADDLTYQVPPGTDCSETGDILGLIATRNIIISDDNLQRPFRVNSTYVGMYDDTSADENYNGFLLTLQNFYSEITGLPGYSGETNPGMPGTTGEMCGTGVAGCFRLAGGQILGRMDYWTLWPVTDTKSSGWTQQISYDPCGASNPPPYFPTTGRYVRSMNYEIDPVWLNQIGIGNYFARLTSN